MHDEVVDADTPVETSWTRVSTWLQTHAPATAAALRPPASPEDVSRAEKSTGVVWPQQLRTWFRLHDGWDRDVWASVLPGWSSPMSVERAVEAWQVHQDVMQEIAADHEGSADLLAQGVQDEAGQPAGVFLPSFVPVDEDQSGTYLFVDCRLGPRHGCVTQWDKYEGDGSGSGWWSIAQMLSDVADHLEEQTPCRYWRPRVEDGFLGWKLDASLGSASRCLARSPQ